jgi:hypothetical protein
LIADQFELKEQKKRMEDYYLSFNERGVSALQETLEKYGKPDLVLEAFIADICNLEFFSGSEQIKSDYEIASNYTKSGHPFLFRVLPEYFDIKRES